MRLLKKNYSKYTDEKLMLLFQKGDRKAFEYIYDRYSDHLVNFFYKKLWQDKEKAEDIAQDIFTKLINKPGLFDATKNFKTWIFTIAYNNCKNEYKKQETRKNANHRIDDFYQGVDKNDLGDKQVDKNSFGQRLKEELAELSEKHRDVFNMRHDQGLSLKEIAEAMGISEGTVKSRLHYTTKFLAKKLKAFRNIMAE